MLLEYADLLWKVPFWVGLAVAVLLAAIAWGRNSRRAANSAFTLVWLLGIPWAIGYVWNSSVVEDERSRSAPAAGRLEAAENQYRNTTQYGIALGAVFVFSLSALLRVRSAPKKARPGLKQRLEAEYRKKVIESDYEPPGSADS